MKQRIPALVVLLLAGVAMAFPAAALAEKARRKGSVTYLETPSGVRFGIRGEKGPAAAPTLFVFASDIQSALENKDFNKVGQLLGQHGFLTVSLDVPGHGQ